VHALYRHVWPVSAAIARACAGILGIITGVISLGYGIFQVQASPAQSKKIARQP
jgi:hypothetical protein